MQKSHSIIIQGVIFFLITSGVLVHLPLEAEASLIPHIEIQPFAQEVAHQEIFQVDIHVDAMHHRLRGVRIDLSYNPTVFRVVNITQGPLFGSTGVTFPGSGDDGAGTIHYTMLTGNRLNLSEGVFLTVEFLIIGGMPNSVHRLDLQGILYSWSYDILPGVEINSGFIRIEEYESDEFFSSVEVTGVDSDGDGFNDSAEATMYVGTTGGTITVDVQGYLTDSLGGVADEIWVTKTLQGGSITFFSLLLSGDGPQDVYTITLNLFDTLHNWEDTWSGTIFLFPPVPELTYVNITPADYTVPRGQTFILTVTIDPGESIAGIQLGIRFNSTLFMVTEVWEGTVFQGLNRHFNPGIIDNTNGTLLNVYGTAIQSSFSSPGTFIHLNCTAKENVGVGEFYLMDILLGDPMGASLPVISGNATVLVSDEICCDLNGDGRVNVLDMVMIAKRWGEEGSPCWIPEDLNCDGLIDQLDALLMGQHWTG